MTRFEALALHLHAPRLALFRRTSRAGALLTKADRLDLITRLGDHDMAFSGVAGRSFRLVESCDPGAFEARVFRDAHLKIHAYQTHAAEDISKIAHARCAREKGKQL